MQTTTPEQMTQDELAAALTALGAERFDLTLAGMRGEPVGERLGAIDGEIRQLNLAYRALTGHGWRWQRGVGPLYVGTPHTRR